MKNYSGGSKWRPMEMNVGWKRNPQIRAGTWAVLFMDHTKHDILARPEARHVTINFGPCRHDTNARVVSCLGS
jgi:hypothetical protein